MSYKTSFIYYLVCCLRQIFAAISAFQWFLSRKADFLPLMRVTHFTQCEIDFLRSQSLLHLINVFSELIWTFKSYIEVFQNFYAFCFAAT